MDQRRLARNAPAAGVAAYVLVASVVDPSAAGVGELSTTLLGVGLDKWLHLATYATLGILLAFARDARTWSSLLVVGLVVAVYGGGIEVVQAFVPARSFDLADAAANALGALLGTGVWRGATERWPGRD